MSKRARESDPTPAVGEFKRARGEAVQETRAAEVRDDFGDDPDGEEDKSILQLDNKQQHAVELAITGHSVFIEGGPGSGKSMLVRLITEALRQLGRTVQVLTHTESTAQIVNGQTINSFITRTVKRRDIESMIKRINSLDVLREQWIDPRLTFIVDNGESIAMDDFRFLNGIAQDLRGDKRPFGGAQVIVCADPFGLPPIMHSRDSSPYIFQSSMTWNKVNWQTVRLRRNYRAATPEFAALVERARRGKLTAQDHRDMAKRLEAKAPDDGLFTTIVHRSNKAKSAANNKFLMQLCQTEPGEKYVSTLMLERPGSVPRDAFENDKRALQQRFPGERRLKLARGAVVELVSTLGPDLPEGMRGVVREFESGVGGIKYPIVYFSNGRKVKIDFTTKRKFWPKFNVWVLCQRLPLRLAFATNPYNIYGRGVKRLGANICDELRTYAYMILGRLSCLEDLYLYGSYKPSLFTPNEHVVQFDAQLVESKIEPELTARQQAVLDKVIRDRKFLVPAILVPSDAATEQEFARLVAEHKSKIESKRSGQNKKSKSERLQQKRATIETSVIDLVDSAADAAQRQADDHVKMLSQCSAFDESLR